MQFKCDVISLLLPQGVSLCFVIGLSLSPAVVTMRMLLGVLVDGESRVEAVVLPTQIGPSEPVDIRVIVEHRNGNVSG